MKKCQEPKIVTIFNSKKSQEKLLIENTCNALDIRETANGNLNSFSEPKQEIKKEPTVPHNGNLTPLI